MYNINKYYLSHDSGTKEYRILLVENKKTGKALVNFRWGRVGTFGQQEVHVCDSSSQASTLVRKKLNERLKRGYKETVKTARAETQPALIEAMGHQAYYNMGVDTLHAFDPTLSVAGVKTGGTDKKMVPINPEAIKEEAERMEKEEVNRKLTEKLETEQAQQKQRESVPDWGAF